MLMKSTPFLPGLPHGAHWALTAPSPLFPAEPSSRPEGPRGPAPTWVHGLLPELRGGPSISASGWAGDASLPPFCPSPSRLPISPTGRDAENNQGALEDFKTFARDKGFDPEKIFTLTRHGREDTLA